MSCTLRTWFLTAAAVATLALGCGDDDGPGPGTDAGPGDDGSPGDDAGPGDTEAPTVVGTVPADGEVEVDPSTAIRIVFSEAIDLAAGGAIDVEADGAAVSTSAPTEGAGAREVTVTPDEPLPTNTAIRVTVAGFADLAGNAMAAMHELEFTTSDPVAPVVSEATPAEGAADVDPAITEITVLFSESMNAALGAATLRGGPGTLGAPVWDGARATFPVSDLAPGTAYAVDLVGFADPAGNALDGTAYLGDGALDFSTGADSTAPVVTEASPSEGATSIPPTRTTRVRLVFSEPMDEGAGTASLDDAGTLTELDATWAGGGTILLLDVGGLLEGDRPYRVVLDGYTDVAGNPLDGAAYLGDGALDFTTGEDELPPFVLFTNPAESAADVHWTTTSIFVTFSEAMDTSITDVPVTDGVSSSTLTGTWSSGGALLDVDVSGQLVSGRTYTLDFTGFYDADGLPLDATHPYLGDGRLDITLQAPAGENCQDFLTEAEATVTAPGTMQWTITTDQVSNVDGAASCDASGGSADAVIRYVKTSPDSTDTTGAGRVVRITADSSSTLTNKDINVEVLTGACDPTTAPPTARLECLANEETHVLELDLPAGEHYIWVAASATAFRGATVTIEEIPAVPGDTCRSALPITAGTTTITPSSTLSWNAPSCAGGALTWYRYTASQNAAFVSANGSGSIAIVDATTGREAGCSADAVVTPVGGAITAGSDVCIAVRSGGTISSITIEEVPYSGVRGEATQLGISRPSTGFFSSPGWLIADATTLYAAQTDGILVAPKAGMAEQVEVVMPISVMGNAAALVGTAIFSLDNATTTSERLYRLEPDGAGGFVTTAWDTGSTYTGGTEALFWDGTTFHIASYASASGTAPTSFYTVSGAAPGTATLVGTNDTLREVSGMALDSTWIYAVATVGTEEGLFRLRRSDLGNPAAMPETLYLGENLSDRNAAVVIDDATAATVLYYRTYSTPSNIYAVLAPGSASPRRITLYSVGRLNDNALVLDPSGDALYLYESGSTTAGNYIRLD